MLIVSCDVADPLPGLTEAGEKVAVAPIGSPLAVRATEFGNVPLCAVTVTEYCADPPVGIVCAAVDEDTVKLGAAVPEPCRLTV